MLPINYSPKRTLRLTNKGIESKNRQDGGTREQKDRRKQQHKQQVMIHKYKGNIEIKVENFWLIRGKRVKE